MNTWFGEGTALGEHIPEGTDVGALAESVVDQLIDKDSKFHKAVDLILDSAKTENGEWDMDVITSYAQSVKSYLDSITEAGDMDDLSYYDFGEDYADAIEAYVREENAGVLKEGDTTLYAPMFSYKTERSKY